MNSKMKDHNKKNIGSRVLFLSFYVIIIVVMLGLYFVYKNISASSHSRSEETIQISKEDINEIMKPNKMDLVYGSGSVVVVEYFSTSCNSCKKVNKYLIPELREKHIEKNHITLIRRHFPLNRAALKAAVVIECNRDNNNLDKILDIMYKIVPHASDAVDAEKMILDNLAGRYNLTKDMLEDCMGDKNIYNELITSKNRSKSLLSIKMTPVFIVQGEVIIGYMDFATMDNIINRKMDISKEQPISEQDNK